MAQRRARPKALTRWQLMGQGPHSTAAALSLQRTVNRRHSGGQHPPVARSGGPHPPHNLPRAGSMLHTLSGALLAPAAFRPRHVNCSAFREEMVKQ